MKDRRRPPGGRAARPARTTASTRGPVSASPAASFRDRLSVETADERGHLFEALLQAAPDAIVVSDRDGLIRFVNRQVEVLFGYPRDELLGKSIELLVPERLRSLHRKKREGYLTDPRVRPMDSGLDLSARRKDGSLFPADISLSAIETAEGPLISAALRDVTHIRRVAERGRLAAIVDSSSDAILSKSLDGTITTWNPAAEHIYGWTAAEAIGRNVSIMYPPEGTHELAMTLERVARGERAEALETVRVRKDGTRLDMLVSVSPIRDEQMRIVGASVIGRDVTEKVATEKQRQKLESQLQQSQRLEIVGRLAGGIAHDFNNLIAVILNYASFVSDELGDRPELRDDVNEIRRAAERAAALTRQLLIFSRREVAHPEALDLSSVVADMRKLLERTIGEHIELVTRVQPDLWTVTADRGQIEQVIMNLAVNARDAMPQGGRLVLEASNALLDPDFVASEVGLQTGRYVRLVIADTGSGMTRAVADRAFEPFFTTKQPGLGTGLGLATVHGIVTQAGGKVALYSELGRGTSVKIHLPAVAQNLPTPPSPAEAKDERAHGEVILLVEDEAAVRSAARRILARNGYVVLEAGTPSTALDLVGDLTRRLDLVLSDVVMPEMSGIELAGRIRARRPHVPIVFMSGYPQDALAHQGVFEGDMRLLEKPFGSESLLRAVRDALAAA